MLDDPATRVWSQQVTNNYRRRPNRLCAEDGAIYLFENTRGQNMLNYNISDYVDVNSNGTNRYRSSLGNLRIACYGTYVNLPVGPVKLCSSIKKPVPCQDLADAIGIEYWTCG